MKILFQVIDKTQLDKFYAICKVCSCDENEFHLEEIKIDEPISNGMYISYGAAVVSRNNQRKIYRVGNGSVWPSGFEEDLENAFFD